MSGTQEVISKYVGCPFGSNSQPSSFITTCLTDHIIGPLDDLAIGDKGTVLVSTGGLAQLLLLLPENQCKQFMFFSPGALLTAQKMIKLRYLFPWLLG